MKLFLWTESIENMVTMMKLFWFVFVWIIFSGKVSNQTLVTSNMFDVILVTTCWLFEQLWNSIAINSGDNWMFSDLRERQSFVLVNKEAFSDEILEVFRKIFEERDIVFHDFDFKLIFSGAIPRYFSMNHFINDNTHWPDIIFDRVDVWSEGLWTHVKGWADIDCLFGIGSYSFSKSKISDFSNFVLDEQISRFQVSVQEPSVPQMPETFDEVSDYGDGFLFWEFDSFFYESFQISFITEFSDDVAIIGSTVDIVAFKDVGMIEFFECINLALKHFFLGFALDGLDIDDFDGDGLLVFLVDASVDDRTETFADDVLETVGVVFYFFSEIIIRIELTIHVWQYEI